LLRDKKDRWANLANNHHQSSIIGDIDLLQEIKVLGCG
jgi:hypothetical protein